MHFGIFEDLFWLLQHRMKENRASLNYSTYLKTTVGLDNDAVTICRHNRCPAQPTAGSQFTQMLDTKFNVVKILWPRSEMANLLATITTSSCINRAASSDVLTGTHIIEGFLVLWSHTSNGECRVGHTLLPLRFWLLWLNVGTQLIIAVLVVQ